MTTDRFPRPPKPSLPREAPWREVEEIIDVLKGVATKFDTLIEAIRGMPAFPGAPAVTTISIDGRLDLLIQKLDDFLRTIPIAGAPGPLTLDGRLDEIVKYIRNRPAWDHGHKDVVAAGTAEQLPSVPVPDGLELVVRANPSNTDDIYLGKNKTDATRSTTRITLAPGEATKLRVTNANVYYVDAAVSGEGVEYFVEKD